MPLVIQVENLVRMGQYESGIQGISLGWQSGDISM